MFTPIVRLILLIVLGITATLMAYYGHVPFLIIASLISLFILWDYLRRGTVPLAMRRINQQDFEAAKQILSFNNNPERLANSQTAYYYLADGLIKHHFDAFEDAKASLEKSLAIGMKNHTYKAMCLIALTDIAIVQKNHALAHDYFNQMDGLKISKQLINTVQKLQSYLQTL